MTQIIGQPLAAPRDSRHTPCGAEVRSPAAFTRHVNRCCSCRAYYAVRGRRT